MREPTRGLPEKGGCAYEAHSLLLTVAAMMAVMMVASAAPAFALPPNPVRGQVVADFARTLPPNPVHGQLVSQVARGLPVECGLEVDQCPFS
jgi:hypothetical protein